MSSKKDDQIAESVQHVAREVHIVHEVLEKGFKELIKHLGSPPKPNVRFDWTVGPVTEKPKQIPNMEIKITNEQQVRVDLAPKTDSGKPASLDGMPSWSTISGNSQAVVDDDGLGALLVSSDDPGTTVFLIKADADLGEGVEELSDTITLVVNAATAKNLGLSVGTPEVKP